MTEAPPLYNSRVIKNYLEYLERHHPDVSMNPLLSAAGMERAEVEDPGHWFAQAQINGFHNALGRVVRDPQLARKAGRFSQASRTAGVLTRYVLRFMTPMAAYRSVADVASEWTRAPDYEARPVSEGLIALTVTPRPNTQEQPFQCGNRIGMLEALAKLFTGQYADIEHPTCIHRGDARCLYHIAWHLLPSTRLKRWLRCGLPGSLCVLATTATFLPLHLWLFEMAGWGIALGSVGALAMILENRELKRQMTRKGDAANRNIQEIKYHYRGAFLIQEIGFFTTKGDGRGTGMGLAVVHGIVERIGGAISVDSTPGEGSCFIVFLPAIEDRPSTFLPASLKVPGGSERILFVDDEPFQADLGCQMLGRLWWGIASKPSPAVRKPWRLLKPIRRPAIGSLPI